MKVLIVDQVSVGSIGFHLFPENAAERFFLRLLQKEDPEMFGTNSSWSDPREEDCPECIVSVDKKHKRDAKKRMLDDCKTAAN